MNRGVRRPFLPLLAMALLVGCQAAPAPTGPSRSQGASGPSSVPNESAGPIPSTAAFVPSSADCDAILADVDGFSARLETGVESGTASPDDLTRLASCLGIAVVPRGTDQTTIDATMSGKDPAITQSLLDLVATSGPGFLFDIDSLVTDLASFGIRAGRDAAPLTPKALDSAIQSASTVDGSGGAAARLLVRLGKARATAAGLPSSDPLWGERRLDNLQFLILASALVVAPADGATGAIRLASAHGRPDPPRLAAGGGSTAGNWLAGLGSQFRRVRSNLTFSNLRYPACILLNQEVTQLLVDQSPTDLWHRGDPGTSRADLIFTLVRKHLSDSVWLAAGCPPPAGSNPVGGGQFDAISGMVVSYELDAAAHKHGELTNMTYTTDSGGNVGATYTTVAETTPLPERIPENEQKVQASIKATVANVVPGLPNARVSPRNAKTFTVHWYEPSYKIGIDWDFFGTDAAFQGTVALHGVVRLHRAEPNVPDSREYIGEADLAFNTTPQTMQCAFAWEGHGDVHVGAQATIPDPLDPTTFSLSLGLDLGSIPRDTVKGTACPPDPGGIVASSGKLSLLILFVTGTWSDVISPTNPTIQFKGWQRSTEPGVILVRTVRSSCGTPPICDLRGELRLEQP